MISVPFTADEFFRVFEAYNRSVWPAQLLLLAAALAALSGPLRRARRDRWVPAILGGLWLWAGVAYHILHFSAINGAAVVFGALFVVQGALLLVWGVVKGGMSFPAERGVDGRVLAGWLIVAYALLVYPVLSWATEHPWMASPTFGAPCPTVIYTFGMLLLVGSVPWWILVVPVAWAIVGSSAVFALGVVQDAGLLVSALVCLAFVVRERSRRPDSALG